MAAPNNAVAVQKTATVRDMLAKSKQQIEMALPKHVQADRLIRVAMTSIQRNPKLLDCSPMSLMAAIMQSAQLGLMPDGVLGEAYLIPFKDQVQFIVGYRGLISLARRSGEIVSLAAHCVHENDLFEFEYGLDEKLRHVPNLDDRGSMVAVYGVAKLKDGGHGIEIMSRRDIDAIRDESQGYKSAIKYGNDHPWISHYDQMARKTVLRRLSKYLPVSVEMLEAIAVDEQADMGRMSFTTVDNGQDLIPTKRAVERLNERFSGEVIDADTGEVSSAPQTETSKAVKQAQEGTHQAVQARIEENVDSGIRDQEIGSKTPESNPEPEPPKMSPDTIARVKLFYKEIDACTTSAMIDQWRAKHHKRVQNAFGGAENPAYTQVVDYAEIKYRELFESEQG
jgi:recombination protein RecT